MRWRHVALGAAMVALVAAPARPVFAHAELESTTPAANAVLETEPPRIVLDFDEAVDPTLSDVRLFDQNAHRIPLGTAGAGGDSTIVTASVPPIGDGVYVVVWRVPSDDGHVVDGVFSFQVGAQSNVDVRALIDKVSGNASATSTVGRLETASRLLAFIGLIVLIGGGVLVLQISEVAGNGTLLRMAWVLLAVGTIGQYGMYGAKVVAGSPSDAFRLAVWSRIADSHTGTLLIIRFVLVAALAFVLATLSRRRDLVWRVAALALTAATVVTFSAIGHANTQHPAALWVAMDTLHLAAIGVWIGGLLMLAFGSSSWLTDADHVVAVRRFSVASTVAVPVIVGTGVAQTLRLANRHDLTDTSWGRTLIVKVAVVTVLVAFGGVSQWLLRNDGPASLRHNVFVEALIGVGVIGLAAALVSLSPQSPPAEQVFTTTVAGQGLLADITITPGRVGANEVHLVVAATSGNIGTFTSARVEAQPVDGGDAPAQASLQTIGPNHYSGTITLSKKGDWTVRVIAEPAPGQNVEMTATMTVP